MRRRLLGSAALLSVIACAPLADTPAPERTSTTGTTEAPAWSAAGLARVGERALAAGSDAIIVVADGRTVWAWGDTTRRFRTHSVRKSLLNALYGVHQAHGSIDLRRTLGDLEVDDRSPLTVAERQATIEDLLASRSGVYRTAAHENTRWDRVRPAPGSHAHGAHFFYSNWDFNVAGLVFQRSTRTNLFEEFASRIAGPIGMRDYRAEDGGWRYDLERSSHPAYVFRMSARDLARFGMLYLQEGRWDDVEVVPAAWVRRSTSARSEVRHPRTGELMPGIGYGLHWWVSESGAGIFGGLGFGPGTFWAAGTGEQLLIVSPALRLVIVHRENTDPDDSDAVDGDELAEILRMILAARGSDSPA